LVFAISALIVVEILVARQKRELKKQLNEELDAAEDEFKKKGTS
jgi:hypothetical protein